MINVFLYSIFSFIILTATNGFTITRHYCSNNLVSVSVNAETEPCSHTEGGCCRNESEYYQLDQEYNLPARLSINPEIPATDILFTLSDIHLFFESQLKIKHNLTSNSSSPPCSVDLRTKTQTFLL